MKKILVTLLTIIVLLILAIVGLTLSNHRVNLTQLHFSRLTTRTTTIGQLDQLNLNIRTAKLTIKPGRVNKVTLHHTATNEFNITHQAGTLNLQQTDAGQHQLEIGKSPIVTITVANPHQLKAINGQLLNGTLALSQLTTRTLALKHLNGTTLINHLTVTHGGYFTKTNGRTDLQQLTTDGLNVTIKNGQFKLNGKQQAKTYRQVGTHPLTITSKNGQLSLTTN